MRTSTLFIAVWLLAALAACGGTPTPPEPGPVTLTPKTVTLKAGESNAFSASVAGDARTRVFWNVEGGTPSGIITSEGVYTAPATAGTYTVVATSLADPSKQDTATVTVTPALFVTLAPLSPRVHTTGSIAFRATVTGARDPSVSWSVREPDGGGISAAGVYMAPATEGLYTVVATSKEDPSREASTRVLVEAVGVTVSPPNVSLDAGAVAEFSARVTGSANTAVDWSVEGGSTSGTITAAGLYTAPAAAGLYTVVATSQADPSRRGTATVSVRSVSVSISPTTQTVNTRGTAAFYAQVSGSSGSTAVSWSVEGGDANGTLTAAGVYTAPATEGTFTVVATSVADPTKKATATVTVVAVGLTVAPATAMSEQGAATVFTATVTGTSNTAVRWSVEGGSANGTVTSEGIYTAPGTAGTFTVVATSAADPAKKATATVTVPEAAGASYRDPPGTGWRLTRNASASSGNRLVLELVGPAGQSGRGVDLTLSVDPALAFWDKVDASDPEPVRNLKFTLGTAPQYFKGALRAGTLELGVFQKGTSAPATEYTGGLVSVALVVRLGPGVPAGTRILMSVLKAHALPATGNLTPIDVAVGTLTAR